jgi:hypothetical protein
MRFLHEVQAQHSFPVQMDCVECLQKDKHNCISTIECSGVIRANWQSMNPALQPLPRAATMWKNGSGRRRRDIRAHKTHIKSGKPVTNK